MKNKVLSPYILTADIGGSHITAAICNTEQYSIVRESMVRQEVDCHASATEIFASWNNALKEAADKVQFIHGLSVAMPGPFDYENGISFIKGLNKYEALYGLNIKAHFADFLKLGHSFVKFRNDAEATIAGEVLAGAGKGISVVMGVTLGTGFGSALYKEGVTIDLNLGGQSFKESIADDYLSTRWFLQRYLQLTGENASNVKELALKAESLPVVESIFREFAVNAAKVLSKAINEFKPDALIICGNIARAHSLFLPYLKDLLLPVPVHLAQLGEQAALIGASGLFESVTSDNKY